MSVSYKIPLSSLGLLLLVISCDGEDMLQPMTIAVIGCLFFSQFVTLFLLPNLYFIFERRSVGKLS